MLTLYAYASTIVDMITATTNLAEAAHSYADRGWHVFPCRVRGKEPNGALAPNGYKSATDDHDIINAWFSKTNYNIGIACRPSGIVVIDVDYRADGAYDDARTLWGNTLEQTYTVETGNGVHFYYSVDDTSHSMRGKLYSLDVKWNGYVIAAPSTHPNGHIYTADNAFIVRAPDALLELIVR